MQQYERFLLQKKGKRWGKRGPQTDDELVLEVEGTMLAASVSLGAVARYQALKKERARRGPRVEGPYGMVNEEAKTP